MNYVLKTEVLKEPRGFIKIIQFLFSILAFACLVDWRGHLSFEVDCKGDKKIIQKTFQYPFAMDEVKLERPICKNDSGAKEPTDFAVNAVHSSQFFVFIGVIAFLASAAICAGYMLYEDVYMSTPRYAWADIFLHGALAFFWFVASCAYAAEIWKIKKFSSFDGATKGEGAPAFDDCQKHTCKSLTNPTYANLDIAALCGFVNVFLWGANIWFLYKETRQNAGEFPNDLVQDSPTGGVGGYEPYPGSSAGGSGYEPYPGSGMGGGSGGGGGSMGGGGQWGAGQSSVQGGMNEI